MFNVFSMVDSYGAVDKWLATLNTQAKNSIKTGYKAERLTFTGSATEVRQQSPFKLYQQAEGSLNYHEYTDFSAGDISISSSNNHAAIAGEGYFLVTDGNGRYFYSRDGEFQRDEAGVLVNQAGLYVVDQAMALSLPAASFAYTPPTVNAATVNAGTAGWQKGQADTTGQWFPYVAGTTFDEGASRYTNQTVYAKNTVFINNNDLTGSITVRADDLAYIIVNGTVINPFVPSQLSPTNVSDAQQPIVWASGGPTAFNISQYLKPGANSIVIKATEFTGGEGISVSGTVGGQAITEANFAYKVAVTQPDPTTEPGYPGTIEFASAGVRHDYTRFGLSPDDWDAIYGNAKDVLLVNGPTDKTEFKQTMYGNTVFEWPKRPAVLNLELPGNNGTGDLVFNALETSNVRLQQLAPEIAMAQQMYSNLKTILQLKKSNFDLIMQAVK
jgi:flagellar hook-basal body protein